MMIKNSLEFATQTYLTIVNLHMESVFIEMCKDHMDAKITNMMDHLNATIASALEQLRVENELVYLIRYNYNIDLTNPK